MVWRHASLQIFCIALALAAARSPASAQEQAATNPANVPSKQEPAESAKPLLPWTDSLAKGLAQSQKSRRPVLAIVGGKSCQFCRQLEREIEKAAVQTELARWTLISLDVDAAPEDARTLAVGPIPALRVLTPAGKTIASHDGALSADELITWLGEQFESASGGLDPELLAGDSLSALTAIKLVKELRRRDPAVREAAIRQLLPHPHLAAGPVSTDFAEGPLSARLAAMELLEAWKAPVKGLDPWRPETMTEPQLKAIIEWAATIDENAAAELAKNRSLAPEEKTEASERIARLLKASPADAAAIREQLARYGVALLPEVYERLKAAETDEAREALTALRYRLAAVDRLILDWPGGVERLAAGNASVRRQAMDELASRAGPEEEALLLELFSDPEPLLREMALGALYRISGENADGALIRLLNDPEPNVRAAVLKQLGESSPRAIIPKIVKYVETEKDPDLIVQAIRVLREAPTQASMNCLISLLKNESWRIRAEAAEALGKTSERGHDGSVDDRADMYVALVELLKDPDPFVVSRAVTVLGKADLVTTVDPLAETATRHPALAVEVVNALSSNRANSDRVEKHLKQFSQSADPFVRAAAITGTYKIGGENLETALIAALQDTESVVRAAAAESFFSLLNSNASSGGFYDPSPPPQKPAEKSKQESKPSSETSQEGSTEPPTEKPAPPPDDIDFKPNADSLGDENQEALSQADPEEIVSQQRKRFPKWAPQIAPLLKKQLAAPEVEERLPAALSLIALGKSDEALPFLSKFVEQSPQFAGRVADALYWLSWEKRQAFFTELLSKPKSPDELGVITRQFVQRRDLRAAEPLWSLLAAPDMNGVRAQHLFSALNHLYLGDYYYSPDRASRAERTRLEADAAARASSTSRWQRLTAFALLLATNKEKCAEIAQDLKTKAADNPGEQADATRLLLLALEPADASKEAQAAFASPLPEIRSLGLAFFTVGASELTSLEKDSFSLTEHYSFHSADSEPRIPNNLSPESLTPLLVSQSPEEKAQAGYLLCLLDHAEGLPPLVEHWRVREKSSDRWRKLVYRAAAALGDDHLPLLEEIYATLGAKRPENHSAAADFYWTIRSLKSPAALALRKKIREEVGMDNLRTYEPRGAF